MNPDLLLPYLFAATVAVYLLWLLANKYGALGLLIVSAPIHRLSVDIGFSLKLFYVVVIWMIVLNIWRAKGDPLVLRTNTLFRLLLWFFAAVLVSSLVNGAATTSLRHLVVFAFVFAGCYLVYGELRTRDDIKRLVDVYLVSGLFLGVSGLLFYALYFVVPGIYVEGGFFDAVTYDVERPWTVPLLQSVDVGPNAYALSLLPFLLVAMGAMVRPAPPKRKVYASTIFFLLVLNLLLTFSRGGVIAFLLAALFWVFTLRGRTPLKAILAMSILALTPMLPRAIDLYRQYSYLKGSYTGQDETLLSGRDVLVTSSLNVATEHPLFGVGEGNITEAQYVGKQAHNTYLELLAENGSIAFVICAAIVALLFRTLWRARRALRFAETYAICMAFAWGYVALLVALIPTSAITMPLLWIQATIIYAITRVYRTDLERFASNGMRLRA